MSDEYTPDTEHVRDMYVIGELQDDAIDESQHAPFIADFDRWLAAHDAKVKAEALRAQADSLEAVPDYMPSDYDRGRVDQRHAMAMELYEYADKIESGDISPYQA